jgi:hypothetical protein
MIKEQEQAIVKAIASIYAVCERKLPEGFIDFWLEEIENDDLDFQNCMKAFRAIYKKIRPGAWPPSYEDFVKLVKPAMSERDEGVLLATQIITALTNHGYVWPMNGGYEPHESFQVAFIFELGEFAWEVLKQYGGYQRLHDHWVESGENFRPQLRDFIIGLRAREKAGLLNTKIGMTESKKIGEQKKLEKLTYWL